MPLLFIGGMFVLMLVYLLMAVRQGRLPAYQKALQAGQLPKPILISILGTLVASALLLPRVHALRPLRVLLIPPIGSTDVNMDAVTNIIDIELVAGARGMTSADPDWMPAYDLNGDGVINDVDTTLVADRWRLGQTTILRTSPARGESKVSVTRETVIEFDRPLDPDTVISSTIFAQFGGDILPAHLRLSPDGYRVTLFYDEPLPPSARVRVTVDGNALRDMAGHTVDADGDGLAGGVGKIDFDTLGLTRIPGTEVWGYVYDSYDETPIVGATIRVDGFPEANAVTDQNGYFILHDMPAPEFFVHIDGSTATNAPPGMTYPVVGKPFHSIAGQSTQLLMGPSPFNIYLPPMAFGDIHPLSANNDTAVGFGATGLAELHAMFPDVDPSVWQLTQVTFPAGSAIDENGNTATQAVIIPVPPDRIPAPLPPYLNMPLVISVQAIGATNFDTPAPVCFPNLPDPDTGEILGPGDKSAFFSFNHDTGQWEMAGPMTVSDDGVMVCTDPGVGIRAPGWGGTQQGSTGNCGALPGNPPSGSGSNATVDIVQPPTDVITIRTGAKGYFAAQGSPAGGKYNWSGGMSVGPTDQSAYTAKFGDTPTTDTVMVTYSVDETVTSIDPCTGTPTNQTVTLTSPPDSVVVNVTIDGCNVEISGPDVINIGAGADVAFMAVGDPDNGKYSWTGGQPLGPTDQNTYIAQFATDSDVIVVYACIDPNSGQVTGTVTDAVKVKTISGCNVEIVAPNNYSNLINVEPNVDITLFADADPPSGNSADYMWRGGGMPPIGQGNTFITKFSASASSTALVTVEFTCPPSAGGVKIVDTIAILINVSNKTVTGYLGNVVAIDILGLFGAGYMDFQFASSTDTGRGRAIDIYSGFPTNFFTSGVFYFVPNLDTSGSGIGKSSLQISAKKNGSQVQLTVEFQIANGYSAFTMNGSVGPGVLNDPLDVYRVQQRLKHFGFFGKKLICTANNPEITVNGTVDNITTEAIRLFLAAATNRAFDSDPADYVGRIETPTEIAWLNAFNAPRWQVLAAWHGPGLRNEVWGTSWTQDVIARAVTLRHDLLREDLAGLHIGDPLGANALTEYPDFGNPPPLPEDPICGVEHPNDHKAGRDIDWAIDEETVDAGIGTHPIDPTRPIFDQLSDAEKQIVYDIQAFRQVGGAQYYTVYISYERIRTALTEKRIPSKNISGHSNHFHIRLVPPVLGGSPVLAPGTNAASPALSPQPTSLQLGLHYFAIVETLTGQVVQRGVAGNNGIAHSNLILAPNTHYEDWILQASTLDVGFAPFITPNSGQSFVMPNIPIEPPYYLLDEDNDGLHDTGELIMGTDPNDPDSDNDGIFDGPEVQQGLNPLDGRPAATGVIAAADTPGTAVDVCATNDLVAVADSGEGVSIFNAYNGASPVAIAHVDTPGTAQRVACVSNLTATTGQTLVAVADGEGGLVVIDLTDPPAAYVKYTVSQYALGGLAETVVAAGGVAYVGTSTGWLASVDLATGTMLERLPISTAIEDLAIEGDTLFVLSPDTLYAVPLQQGELSISGAAISPYVHLPNRRLFVGGGIAYAVHSRGYNTFDLANPNIPVLIANGSTNQFDWKQVAANGSGLGIAAVGVNGRAPNNDISLYDISDPAATNQFITTFQTPGIPYASSIYNGLAYVADGESGLEVINYLAYDVNGISPAISLNANFSLSPAQAEEGQALRVSAIVDDDVQVRNVEFYLDGVRVGVDGGFPFEHRFIAPRLATQSSFALQAKASDTGGNITWTEVFTVSLTADVTPPTVTHVSPADGAIAGNTGAVVAYFDEPIDPAILTSAAFTLAEAGVDGLLGTSDDVAVSNGVLEFRTELLAAFMNFAAPLPPGYYQANTTTALTDLAGNPLAAGQTWAFRVFVVGDDADNDCVPDTVEPALGLDPNNPDTDGDTISDGDEDYDTDGLTNCTEVILGTDLTDSDTDGDGILDGDEDTDFDELPDGGEVAFYGTNPFDFDTDNDRAHDGVEILSGTDPLDPNSNPFAFLPGETNNTTISVVNFADPYAPDNLPGEVNSTIISIVNETDPYAPDNLPGEVNSTIISVENQP